MNPKVPEMIIEHLRGAGYDIRTELGDSIIYQGDQSHLIYIQVRDSKKTYIPITLTAPILTSEPEVEVETKSESQIRYLDELPHLETPPIEPTEEKIIESLPVLTSAPVWDENVTELLVKIQTTKQTLRNLIQP